MQIDFLGKVDWMIKLDFSKSLKVEHKSLEMDEENVWQGVKFPKLMDLFNFFITSVAIVVAYDLRLNHFVKAVLKRGLVLDFE